MLVARPTCRGLRIAHHHRTSNAEAHAICCDPICHARGNECGIEARKAYRRSIYRCLVPDGV